MKIEESIPFHVFLSFVTNSEIRNRVQRRCFKFANPLKHIRRWWHDWEPLWWWEFQKLSLSLLPLRREQSSFPTFCVVIIRMAFSRAFNALFHNSQLFLSQSYVLYDRRARTDEGGRCNDKPLLFKTIWMVVEDLGDDPYVNWTVGMRISHLKYSF